MTTQVTGRIKRGLCGVLLFGALTATLRGSAFASAPNPCHNPSGCPIPVNLPGPTIDADAAYTNVTVWGSHFTPGYVAIIVTDSQTKVIEASTVLAANGSGTFSWYSMTKDVCEGGNVPRIVNAEDLSTQKMSNTVLAGCH